MRTVLIAATILAISTPCLGAEPRIDVELVTEPGFPLGGAQRWIQVLKEMGQSGLRIRSARAGDTVTVENRGSETAPRYHVVGALTASNRLRLSGAEFSLSDRARIASWFEKLKSEGVQAIRGETLAFGLTSEQLVGFHDRLAGAIDFSTKGRRTGDVARQLIQGLELEFEVTATASRAFHRNEAVLDELQGLSAGTALAALLRPLGLVVAPKRKPGRDVTLLVAEVRELEESWPVGWPSQGPPVKVAPGMFERINVEIRDTMLSEALSAIQQRVEVPFLFDHNSLARQQIDPTKVEVSYPDRRASYLQIVSQVLNQAHLNDELRVDEAGKPFLWISTVKQTRVTPRP